MKQALRLASNFVILVSGDADLVLAKDAGTINSEEPVRKQS